MGKTYVRKTNRGQYGQNALEEAMQKVSSKEMGINKASRTFGVPSHTLRRHLISGKNTVELGRVPELGFEHEKRLVRHIRALEKAGFAPDSTSLKKMAYKFAEKLGIKHRFSHDNSSAGNEWLRGFLRRNKELSIRKSEGMSLARAQGMNRKDVDHFFNMLLNILTENDLLDKPSKIFNVDETGIQVNNKPGKVIATKGAKDVFSLTSSEKGENISIISCCNAEGHFLPPVLIFKGKYKKEEFADGLPPGSGVYMNQKSSYVNSEIFFKWFSECFLPKKTPGKTLLILDGHSSHCNGIELLDLATKNDVILLCLPSHTTQALQPLDRSFFKPLKTYFNHETRNWIIQHQNRKLSRNIIWNLIGTAWGKAATVSNGTAGFRACGIHPYNPQIIPEHFFAISDISAKANQQINQENVNINHKVLTPTEPVPSTSKEPEPVPSTSKGTVFHSISKKYEKNHELHESHASPQKSGNLGKNVSVSNNLENKETPSKILVHEYPVPEIPLVNSKRKQGAVELTSPENRAMRQVFAEKKLAKEERIKERELKKCKLDKNSTKNKKKSARKLKKQAVSSDEEEDDHVFSSSDEISDDSDEFCVECKDYYYTTKSKADWIQCQGCEGWLHETCTRHLNLCNKCAKK